MKNKEEGESLADFLETKVFAGGAAVVMEPDEEDMKGYDEFIVNYKNGLAVERAAVDSLKM